MNSIRQRWCGRKWIGDWLLWATMAVVLALLEPPQPLLGAQETPQLSQAEFSTTVHPATSSRSSGDDEWVSIPVQAVLVSDDDGSRAADIDIAFVRQQVEFATSAFRPARIRFTFDPAKDAATLRSTVINNMLGTQDANWRQAKRLANEIAASRYPGKLVVFFRHGRGPQRAGGSFSWFDYDFIASAGREGVGDRYWSLAHEAGHYFGLGHPHPAPPEFDTVAEAEAYFVQRGRKPEVFSGDELSDTPPVPPIKELYWRGDVPSVTLAGHTFHLMRGNVVSYYHFPRPADDVASGVTFTPEQVRRARWFLGMRLRNRMAMPSNTLLRQPIEAEGLKVVERKDCQPREQKMNGFFVGSWSGDAHLFGGGRPGASATVELPSTLPAGRYRLALAFTHAPDFGIVRVLLDGKPVGQTFDGYGPSVVPAGAVSFGEVEITAGGASGPGHHRLTLEVVGKNAASSGHLFGWDAVELTPARDNTSSAAAPGAEAR